MKSIIAPIIINAIVVVSALFKLSFSDAESVSLIPLIICKTRIERNINMDPNTIKTSNNSKKNTLDGLYIFDLSQDTRPPLQPPHDLIFISIFKLILIKNNL